LRLGVDRELDLAAQALSNVNHRKLPESARDPTMDEVAVFTSKRAQWLLPNPGQSESCDPLAHRVEGKHR
jgi:hypothetical protein